MSLVYIIDGNNVVHHPDFFLPKPGLDFRRALLDSIINNKLTGSHNNSVKIVFDGHCRGQELERDLARHIEIIFSRQETADERIKGILEKSSHYKNIVVVSDDKEIRLFVKSLGARSMGVEEFIKRKDRVQKEKDLLKPELTHSQMHKINQELRKIWLK